MAVSILPTAHHPQALTVPARVTDQSVASTPRDFLTSPILEEASASDSAGSPNEPATPVSGRNSQELAIENDDSLQYITTDNSAASLRPDSTITKTLTTVTAPSSNQRRPSQNSLQTPTDRPLKARQNSTTSLQLKRRLTNMTSNIFHPKRQNSQSEKPQERASNDSAPPAFKDVSYDPETATVTTTATVPAPTPRKRFSFHHKSNGNTRENTPPSPASPLDAEGCAPLATVPTREDFGKRKNRSSTGLSLRGRVINFAHGTHKPVARRRASSFDSTRTRPVSKKGESGFYPVERDDDILSPVEVGGGAKARRLSISLPHDFQVDIADLLSEFEWEHKFRGRHGRIGKGATSKITTVHRKGFPNEVFIVKEFRSKTSKEK